MASLILSRPALCRISLQVLLAAFACAFLGMGKKEPIFTVRFYAEAKKEDTDRFAKSITFRHTKREGYIENIPAVHEKNIKAVYPVQAADGTWGCTFVLDHSGRMALEVLSTTRRGTSVVAFVGTVNGAHQVVELLVDKPITDGVIFIPSGLTEMEIGTIVKTWPVVGQKNPKK
jgi:hypothetical protein